MTLVPTDYKESDFKMLLLSHLGSTFDLDFK